MLGMVLLLQAVDSRERCWFCEEVLTGDVLEMWCVSKQMFLRYLCSNGEEILTRRERPYVTDEKGTF